MQLNADSSSYSYHGKNGMKNTFYKSENADFSIDKIILKLTQHDYRVKIQFFIVKSQKF